jgi:hypothetical protein
VKKILLYSLFVSIAISADAQELKTFRGFIEYRFQISRAGLLSEDKKIALKRTINQYAEKESLLTEYYTKLNAGDTALAYAILKKDKFFKNKDDFTMAYMFSLVRMKTLNELFRPCIQVFDDQARGIIVSCTKDQFADLTEEDTRIFEVVCRYVGDLYVDNVKLYEMVRYR